MKKNETIRNAKNLDEIVDIQYGKIGEKKRDEFEQKAQYYVISETLKDARRAVNMTQQQLAEKVGTKKVTSRGSKMASAIFKSQSFIAFSKTDLGGKSPVSFKKIEGYFDASGKEETASDTLIVVAGYLAEAEPWRKFCAAWLTALKEENVPIGEALPVFHTTDFHARMKGFADRTIWTAEKCDLLYSNLIDIINTHTLYPIGIAVSLVDHRKLLAENPALVLAFQKVGSFASGLVFWHCAQWAKRHQYNDFITYIFDRGDKFRTEITNAHRTACKSEEMSKSWRIKRDELKFESKEAYIPIQAADVLAWK